MLLGAVQFSPGVLIILGLGLFGGMAGAWFFQKIHFPQVVGYIVIGLLLGDTGFGLVHPDDVENLHLLNLFALGIIGFLVGGEIKLDMFTKYGREYMIILLGEGVAAFVLVTGFSYIIIYLVTGSVTASLAASVVFGAIASATDPASTIDVIWEYRAKGVMTAAIIAIVALDDALALTLYGIGTSSAQLLVSNTGSVAGSLLHVGIELFGAILLGAVCGFALIGFLRYQPKGDRAVALAVGVILFTIGVAAFYELDVILAAMMLGFIMINFAPKRAEEIVKLTRSFSIPIYVLFFVFVGARMSLGDMPGWLWLIVIAYVVCRSLGKWGGSWIGAKIAGSPEVVKNYLGMAIFAQGGVAIGLSIVAAENLKGVQITETLNLGDMIVYVVTATTLVVQLIGPYMVKLSLKWSGEAGCDITEGDAMAEMDVMQAMIPITEPLDEAMPVRVAFEQFSKQEFSVYPVVNEQGVVCGILTFDALRKVAADQDSWEWMLVMDAMRPLDVFSTPDERLAKAVDVMRVNAVEQMVVVESAQNMRPLGVLDHRAIQHKVQRELLRRTAEQPEAEAV